MQKTIRKIRTIHEDRLKIFLVRKVPVIVRLDGKAFHTFCKRFEKPYDATFNDCLSNTMTYLCKHIQGCVYGQRYSDEISLLLLDTRDPNTEAYFDYEIQKMTSVIAGMCSVEFCRQLLITDSSKLPLDKTFPSFDCKVFNIPNFEIVNYFWDRSLDCVRNSIQGLARTKFNHKQLICINSEQMQEMLFSEYGINWANLPQQQKSGVYCHKTWEMKKVSNNLLFEAPPSLEIVQRSIWKIKPVPQLKTSLKEIIDPLIPKE
jgi:tRNA(His) 5'-end guanylyltransferase